VLQPVDHQAPYSGILEERGRVALNPATGSGEELLRSALNKAELEALEALKLQFFQNATKYLAKGDYDNALSEIKRVLLIDPDHRLAREYEIRVAELQASRAQDLKPDSRSRPEKETPRAAPVVVETARLVTPVAKASRKSWLYVALIALLLLGTAGVLTLERVDDEQQPPPVTVAAVTPQRPAPIEQAAEGAMMQEPTPNVEVPLAIESKQAPLVTETSISRPEPARKDAPPANVTDARPTGSAGIGLLAAVTEKKVEPPSAPVKKEVSAAPLEVKTAASLPPPSEPTREATPFVAVQQDPKIVHLERPVLPDIVMRNHISGSVTAKVLVDKDGTPREVQILESTSSVLEQPVIDAVGKSSFTPGLMGSGPVAAWVVIPFKFK